MEMTRKTMPKKGTTVILRDGDDVNKALRKLKNKVEEGGALKALQKKEHYEKPTTARKRKKAAGRARFLKKLEKEQLPKKLF
jgi:small subunit ribosomal protein S21